MPVRDAPRSGPLRRARAARAAPRDADRAPRRARPRRDERPERSGAVARDRGRPRRRARRPRARRTSTCSTTSSSARARPRGRRGGCGARRRRDRAPLVDVDVPRAELVRLSRGLTPARLARVVALLDPVEMMFALKKLRARRAAREPGARHEPQGEPGAARRRRGRGGAARLRRDRDDGRRLALRAAERDRDPRRLADGPAGRDDAVRDRGAAEPAAGDPGAVTYAETLSVYGTEPVFVDGDDTPWSKAFLASAYASRGVKVRFTSGGGSEALMGESEGKSMLYLEARCLAVVRAAGSQGVQNGSISCVALVLGVPGGTREILAENVLAAWLDLEVASGNDAIASHSPTRRTAKLMGQFLPGTDFVTSGYSVMPRHDNMFGGGNYDADDLDEWLTLQRDWQVDAGIEPLARSGVAGRARARGARGAGGLRRVRLPGDQRRGGPGRDDVHSTRATCPTATAPPTSRPPTACSTRASPRSTSRGRSTRAASPRSRAAVFEHAAPARRGRLPADVGDHRRRRHRRLGASTTRTPTRARAPATGSRASAGSTCRRCRTSIDAASARRGAGDRRAVVEERAVARSATTRTRS